MVGKSPKEGSEEASDYRLEDGCCGRPQRFVPFGCARIVMTIKPAKKLEFEKPSAIRMKKLGEEKVESYNLSVMLGKERARK